MQAAERLVVRREVALRVVRAPPEDVSGAPRATGDERAVAVLRADDLERERIGRRRALTLDVVAIGVPRAADERAELASPRDERALAAFRAWLAFPLELGRLLARQRPRFLVLGVHRARQEPAVPPEPDDHRVTERADLVGLLGREVTATELATLLVDAFLQRAVEGAQQRHPWALASRDLVELLLHACRELEIHVIAEVVDEQVRHDLADELRTQPALLDADVAPVLDRRDRGRVGGRPTDPVLLERLDQRRFREARWRLGEVLGRGDVDDRGRVTFAERRQPGRVGVFLGLVVTALGVDAREPVEQRARRAGAQLVRAVRQLDRRRLELLGRHLGGDGSLPDEPVEAQLLRLEGGLERVGVALEARRADRLVRLLGALGLGLVHAALRHRVRVAVARRDDVAGLAHRHAGHRGRIGSHVRDQADVAVGRVGALVQALRDRHRPLRAETELAARLLLERRGRERGGRLALLGARPGLRDAGMGVPKRGCVAIGGFRIADVQLLPVDADELGGEALPCRRRQDRLERPVLAGDERGDLALPLDDEPHRDGLDAAGRQAAANLARQERAEGVADQTVDDAPRLLRVDEVLVDAPRVGERLADRRFGDLAEGDAARLLARHVRRLRDVPRDGLAFAVEVGGQVDGVGTLRRPLDLGDLLATVVGHDVFGLEVVVDVHAELALARVLRQVADVAVRGQDAVVRPEVALDRARLCRRFHDHEVLWHGRESSTARCTDGQPGTLARVGPRRRGPGGGSLRRSGGHPRDRPSRSPPRPARAGRPGRAPGARCPRSSAGSR